MRKEKQYDRSLVIVQLVDGKPFHGYVFSEDCTTKKAWKSHADKQAGFMSVPTRAMVIEQPPVSAAKMLHARFGIKFECMGNQHNNPDKYFDYNPDQPNCPFTPDRYEPAMVAANYIPTKHVDSPLPF